ncbi:MAG: RNA methyltransferase [Pirellulales bacterium]
MHITSRQNPRLKEAARLRERRARERSGQILIDGGREIGRALAAGVRPLAAFVCEELATGDDARAAVAELQRTAPELFTLTPSVYEKLAYGQRNDGVVLVAELPRRSLADLNLSAEPLIAIIEGVEKPGNLGAILRSADGAGVDAVILADPHTDLFNPNTIRASLGTVFRDNVCSAPVVEVIAWLRELRIPTFATRPDATRLYTEADLSHGAAIVLGTEATGLSEQWNAADIAPIRLPMHGLADSLNVSVTAAVLFYEALRQRG